MRLGLRGRVLGVLGLSLLVFALALVAWLGTAAPGLAGLDPEALRRALLGELLRGSTLGLACALTLAVLGAERLTGEIHDLLLRLRSPAPPGGEEPDELALLVGSFRRLSEGLERASAALKDEKGRLEAVLGAMRDAVLALDPEGRVALANPAAIALLALKEAPIGRTLLEVQRVSELSTLAARALAGQPGAIELELRRVNHAGLPAGSTRVLAAALPQSGGGCVLVLRDVTELRRLETARRDFVANISHELRTPVAVLRASAEALADGALEDPVGGPTLVASIQRNAERLGALIDDLLSLSRMEAGRMDLELEDLELAPEVASACLSLAPRVSARRHTLVQDVPPGLAVRADARALEQALVNLLENAIKYTPEGGRLEVAAVPDGDAVRVEVRDDGPGVAPEHRPRLFERFYRADPGRSRELGGTGLGLAIVKHLAEAMGGSVGMEPRAPRGSVFWVRLPRRSSPL